MNSIIAKNSSRIWPRSIIGVFLLLALIDAIIIYLALQSSVPSIEEQPYEASLVFNDTVEGRRNATKDGVKARVELLTTSISVTLDGLPDNAAVDYTIRLINTRNAAEDRTLQGSAKEPRFSNAFATLKPGAWMVKIGVKAEDRFYFFDSLLHLPTAH